MGARPSTTAIDGGRRGGADAVQHPRGVRPGRAAEQQAYVEEVALALSELPANVLLPSEPGLVQLVVKVRDRDRVPRFPGDETDDDCPPPHP